MNFSDQLLYVKQRLFETRNIIFSLVLIVLTLIILICISTLATILSLKKIVNEDSIETRILVLSGNNINEDELKKIDYVENVVSEKFRHAIIAKSDEYKSEFANLEFELNPLLYKEEIKIINGKNIENDNEIVIPTKFYPYSYYSNEFKENKINDDLIINGKQLIGKEIVVQIPYATYDKDTNKMIDEVKVKTFKVVGTYDPKAIMKEQNNCFISMNDFDKYKSNFSGYGAHEDEYGNIVIDSVDEYNDLMLIINNGKNRKYVEKYLSDKRISYYCPFNWDNTVLSVLTLGPLFIIAIVVIVCLAILSSFIVKKIINRNKNYGVLKSIGYSNSTIINLEVLENYILIILSYIIAFIIYCLAIAILKHSILYPLVINNIDIKYPILPYLLSMLFILWYNRKKIKRKLALYLKSDINVVLKDS